LQISEWEKKKKGDKHLSAYSSNVAVSCQELISAMTDCIKKSSDEYDQLYGEKKKPSMNYKV
jgi:hypothetical protein